MHVYMTSMTSSVKRTDLDFKISVALVLTILQISVTPRLDRWKGNIAIDNLLYHYIGKNAIENTSLLQDTSPFTP